MDPELKYCQSKSRWRLNSTVDWYDTSLIIVITRISVLFSLKCTRKRLAAGLRPDPLGELKRSLRPPSRIRGLGPQERREREGMKGKGGGERKEGRGGGEEGRGRESSSPQCSLAVDAADQIKHKTANFQHKTANIKFKKLISLKHTC